MGEYPAASRPRENVALQHIANVGINRIEDAIEVTRKDDAAPEMDRLERLDLFLSGFEALYTCYKVDSGTVVVYYEVFPATTDL